MDTTLRASRPLRWDEYVPVATWIHRMEPDESPPGETSPYKTLFESPVHNWMNWHTFSMTPLLEED